MTDVVVVDYGMGNLGSVSKSLKKANSQIKISNKHNDIEMSDKIILPGVGNFKKAMKNLESLNLIELLNHKVLEMKTPILGIHLGELGFLAKITTDVMFARLDMVADANYEIQKRMVLKGQIINKEKWFLWIKIFSTSW